MTYISFYFYVFLAILVVIYYCIPLKGRWLVLLIGSLVFYCFIVDFSIIRFSIMIVSSFLCWASGILMEKQARHKMFILVCDIVIVGGALFVVKEASFASIMLLHRYLPEWWIAPVGMAFFSLQLISYVVDVYQGKVTPEKNFLKFLLFVSFFPQIVQGPIPRYDQLSQQLTRGNLFDERKFVNAFMLILWGFFLKMCIADKAGIVVDTIFDNYPAYTGVYVLVGGILYSFQLYADFLGCTTLAQGAAGLFGIEIINNFNHPYFSESIKDFWRRWHISLSSWLRDYVYIPLGGNRHGKIVKYINLMITFVVSGIWHGGGPKFILWGVIHGIYQIVGELFSPFKNILEEKLKLNKYVYMRRLLRNIITFFFVMLAWIIFRADGIKSGVSMIMSMFTIHNAWILTNDALFSLGLGWKEFLILCFCLVVLLIVSYAQERGVIIRDKINQCWLPARWGIYIGVILFVMIFGTYGYGYDAQAFIYGGF